MGKDVTIRVTGQNPDGTMTVQQVDGGNPFGGGSAGTTAMTAYNPQGMAPANQQGGYRATFNGVSVVFASEADFLKADRALREMMESQAAGPSLGGGPVLGGRWGGETTKYLRAGGEGLQTVAAFLNGRNIKRKIEEVQDALEDSREARQELENLERAGKYADLIPTLRRLFVAERDATEASIAALDDQQQAADLQAGGGVAKVFAEVVGDGNGGRGGGDLTTALALGGGALGLGLLLSSRDDNSRSSRRRRGR
jgi:hypothetical protein